MLAPLWPAIAIALLLTTKHFVADFLLQTTWMALGKEERTGWFAPLLAHVAIHAGLTLLIAIMLAPRLWWLAAIDLLIHFAIDWTKGVVRHLGRWSPQDRIFWLLLGFDQYLHQGTNLLLTAAFLAL